VQIECMPNQVRGDPRMRGVGGPASRPFPFFAVFWKGTWACKRSPVASVRRLKPPQTEHSLGDSLQVSGSPSRAGGKCWFPVTGDHQEEQVGLSWLAKLTGSRSCDGL
jgi:hypothetical protein